MARLFTAYSNILAGGGYKALATKVATACTIAGAGDATCQYLQYRGKKKEFHEGLQRKATAEKQVADADAELIRKPQSHPKFQWDSARTFRMVAWTAIVTPPMNWWYQFLMTRFPASAVKRVVADQLIWAPIGTSGFFFSIKTMEGESPEKAVQFTKDNISKALLLNWSMWPFVQYFNFSLVPARFQVLTVNVASFGWNIILSFLANRHK